MATADGDEGIEGTHSEIQRVADTTAGVRRWWRGTVRIGRGAGRQRPLPVNRFSARVDDAAQPSFGRANGAGGGGNDSPAAAAHAIERCERHCERVATRETDHLARNFRRSGLDRQARANRHRVNRSRDLHHQSTHRDNAAVSLDAIYIDDLFGERLHRSAFSAGDTQAINLPLGLPAHALH